MRARYYSPATGRFISADPLSFGGGSVDLYGYAGDSPASRKDPSGRCNLSLGYTDLFPGKPIEHTFLVTTDYTVQQDQFGNAVPYQWDFHADRRGLNTYLSFYAGPFVSEANLDYMGEVNSPHDPITIFDSGNDVPCGGLNQYLSNLVDRIRRTGPYYYLPWQTSNALPKTLLSALGYPFPSLSGRYSTPGKGCLIEIGPYCKPS